MTHSSLIHISHSKPAPAPSTFLTSCEKTSGLSGSDAYVDCDRGFVRGDPTTSCATACNIVNVVLEIVHVGLSPLLAQPEVALQAKVSQLSSSSVM